MPWRLPALRLRVVEVDETCCDETVDPGARVGVKICDKVVCGSSGRSNQNDNGDEPVQEQSSRRSIERLVRCPESAPRQQSFLCKLLVQASVRKADCENVAQIAECDESWKTACSSAVTEDIAEEETGDNDFALCEVGLGNRSKISYVRKHVQNRGSTNSKRRGPTKSLLGVPDFSKDVVGVLPALVGVDDAKKCLTVPVCASSTITVTDLEAECVIEVVRFFDLQVAGKGSEAGEDDEQKDEDLEYSQDVKKADTPLWQDSMESNREGYAGNSDSTRRPAVRRF